MLLFCFLGWAHKVFLQKFSPAKSIGCGRGGGPQNWYTPSPLGFFDTFPIRKIFRKEPKLRRIRNKCFSSKKNNNYVFPPRYPGLRGGGEEIYGLYLFSHFFVCFFHSPSLHLFNVQFCTFLHNHFSNLEPKICPMSHQSLR